MANTSLWPFADVYVGATSVVVPTTVTAAWDAGWTKVGLLDGDAGLVDKRDEKSDEFYAWGGLLIAKTHSQHKRTLKFVALEDNASIFGIINPGSTRSTTTVAPIVTTDTVKAPTYSKIAVGFEVRDGVTIKRRYSTNAELSEVGDILLAENKPTMYEITVTLFPDADGVVFTELSGAAA